MRPASARLRLPAIVGLALACARTSTVPPQSVVGATEITATEITTRVELRPRAAPGPRFVVQRVTGGRPMAFSPDGGLLVSATLDALHLWDTHKGLLRGSIAIADVEAVELKPDRRSMLTKQRWGAKSLELWDTEVVAVRATLETKAWGFALSPDGRLVFAYGVDFGRLWDIESAAELGSLSTNGQPRGRRAVAGADLDVVVVRRTGVLERNAVLSGLG